MAANPVVGVPRALLYYEYGPVWEGFLTALGAEVRVSRPTGRATIDRGVGSALDEACLPVKVAYGHCLELVAAGAEYLFVPRVFSVEPRAYSCPKLLGLPDMVRLAVPDRVTLLAPLIDLSRGNTSRAFRHVAAETGSALGAGYRRTVRASGVLARGITAAVRQGPGMLGAAGTELLPRALRPWPSSGSAPGTRIGVLGHSYNLYDRGLNLDLLGKLAALGVSTITPEGYPQTRIEAAARFALGKPLFWTLGRRLMGAAYLMTADPDLDGVIAVASFGCGPDSMVVDLAMRLVGRRRPDLPFMELTLDEHTGEAGFLTMLEAFVDLVVRRRAG